MVLILSLNQIDDLIRGLRSQGRTVIGPVVAGDVITHEEISSVADLPQGWTEDQDGGRYRLEPTGTDEVFAFSSPSSSWKRFLYPERTLLMRAKRDNGRYEVVQPAPEAPPVAFFGIRSCDLTALGLLDKVFLDPQATDPTYAARRPDVFVVAAACNQPGRTCFCASMGTGPTPRGGFDLSIRERNRPDGGGTPDYLVEAGTDRGAELLASVGGTSAIEADLADGQRADDQAVASMGRHLDPTHPPFAARAWDHPQWDDVASRCLACGNCTMVCPTCFCSRTEDTTDLTATEAERWRVWDSCFSVGFTHMAGGAVRTSVKSRYRQWLLHKLVTWHEQFGSSGCVGCGRCITWCPVGIDLTEEMAALATVSAAPGPDHDTDGGSS
jgi:ferredoxin